MLGWLRNKALWFFAVVAGVSALLALYVMAWGVFDAPSYWVLSSIDQPGDAAPLMVGAFGVLATVCAIGAGILELEHALPRQKIRLGLQLSESNDRIRATLTAQAVGAITSHGYVEAEWSASTGEPLPVGIEPHPSKETLFPGARPWEVRSMHISRNQLEGRIVVCARWWTDRNAGGWQTLSVGPEDLS